MLGSFLNDRALTLDMPKLNPLPLALVAGVALLAGAIAYRSASPESDDVTATATAAGAGSGSAAAQPGARSGVAHLPSERPDALMISDASGARIDAARLFELGFAGGLVIDQDTRSAIEAVLNTMPPEPSDEDLKRLERTLRNGLPREDAERAMKLFTDYRAYTQDIAQQMQPQGIPRNVQEMNTFFDQMQSLQRRHFGEATATALFGPHDQYARIEMEAGFVEQDPNLSPEQKKNQIDALRARLPPDQRQRIPQPNTSGAS
jgi:hypothetical protein